MYVMVKAWGWAARFGDRYDHVLAYWGNYAGTAAYAFHRLIDRPIPFSIWLHAGTDLYGKRKRIFLREKIRYADNVITCCEFNRRFMQDLYPDIAAEISDKTHVCYHGLDLAAFPFVPDSRPPARVIAVGRLARFKGFDYLLRAAQLCRQRGVNVEVEIVGDGPEAGALKALAGELGIADQVTFRGYIPFSDVRTAMSRSTVLVHPSDGLGDGLPNVLREAMAVGTPVIASKVAGIPEALDDGRCGTLVPPKDVAALAQAIERLLGDEERRRRFATLGRRRTEELFDLTRNGVRLAERLRSTLTSGRRRRCAVRGLALRLYYRLPAPARSIAATLEGYYLRWWRYGPMSERLMQEAIEREHWTAEQWRAWRDERLAYVLERAATLVPYYRDQWSARRRQR